MQDHSPELWKEHVPTALVSGTDEVLTTVMWTGQRAGSGWSIREFHPCKGEYRATRNADSRLSS
jgi:hypothetical protein